MKHCRGSAGVIAKGSVPRACLGACRSLRSLMYQGEVGKGKMERRREKGNNGMAFSSLGRG